MKRIIILALVLFASISISSELLSQTIRLERTDVDSTRSSFVTATYVFGIDVYVDNIDSCTAVSFDLRYTEANFIELSHASVGPFGLGGKYPVIIPRRNLDDNTGSVYVGILSSDSADARGYENPMVVHLEFVVTQLAPHGLTTNFSFTNMQAVIGSGINGRIINLNAPPVSYTIHSYVDVWPGDANNDGVVDSRDFTTIGQYIGIGSGTKNLRTFKRLSPSTVWLPQPVLAWDLHDVTFADCDGNGDVNVTDILIARLNFGKMHSKVAKEENIVQNLNFVPKSYITDNSELIPIYINSGTPFLGVSGKISWQDNQSIKVLGAEIGDLFPNENAFFVCNVDDVNREMQIAYVSTGLHSKAVTDGILCYIVVEKSNTTQLEVNISQLFGVSNTSVFPLSLLSDVDEFNFTENDFKFQNIGDYLLFECFNCVETLSLEIFDIMGNLHYSNKMSNSNEMIFIGNYSIGSYYLVVKNTNTYKVFPFNRVR